MAVSLQKGGNISLSKTAPELKNVLIGLGWDARATDGDDFDLDASMFLLGSSGKVGTEEDFLFYNSEWRTLDEITVIRDITTAYNKPGLPCYESLCAIHTGDNRTGDGPGDDEQIKVFLDKVPISVQRIAITVTIHDAVARKQNFGQVEDAYIRLINYDNDVEITRFDLSEDYSTETAMIFGEIYRHNGEWKFKAVGQGYNGGLEAMCSQFGVSVA